MQISNLVSPYKTYIELAVFLALLAALAVGYNRFVDHQRDIGYQRAVSEYQKKLLQAKDEADAQELQWKTQFDTARDEAAKREKKINDSLDLVVIDNGSLHSTIADLRKRLPTNSCEINRAIADTATELLGACAAEYTTMAEVAERRANESLTLSESWPK